MASKKSPGPPAPCVVRTQSAAVELRTRPSSGGNKKGAANAGKRKQERKAILSTGDDKTCVTNWTLPDPLPVTRREVEVLEHFLRNFIDEILQS